MLQSPSDEFHRVLSLYIPVASVVFGFVVLALLFVVLRFRHRPGRTVSRRIEANRWEIAYAVMIAAVVVALVTVTFRAESGEDAVAATPAVRVDAVASDWRWRFSYPQQRITEDGTGEQPTDLYVPAGRTVQFALTSLDVLHAFYIPGEDFQRVAVPRVVNRFDLVFAHPGVQAGQCNEFCGIGHTQMRFVVHVLTPDRFSAWVAAHRPSPGRS